MNKLIVITILMIAFAQITYGQPGRERLQSARIAFITERLDLTPETAQKFWPVYNQMDEQKQALRKEEFSLRRSASTLELSEDEAKKLLGDIYSLKEKQLAMEKEASTNYQEVLSTVQVIQLIKAEEDFRRMVIDQLRDRRGSWREHHGDDRGDY